MYKKILVPLDGSELAECVLPHVETIMQGCGVKEVKFIRVVEPVTLPAGTLTDGGAVFTESDAKNARDSIDAVNESEAAKYLAGVIKRYKKPGLKVESVLLKGRHAEELIDYIKESDADLVIIASHGRSGIGRWIYGSTTEKILRSVCLPILMVRVPGCVAGM
jgi:nucleotide-binding universal stress UspA family protein